ncbi:MAG: hypothetical protein AMJ69_02380 [Gammaproteobacteria bacterium SG8_47]|nr:MAG: hypothetical protein AMJ69_02380 [Gammaproteobacteria bacterium SG8_47]
MNRLVVRPQAPWRSRLIVTLAAVAIVVGGWSLYEYGRFQAGFDSAQAVRSRAELIDRQAQLEAQLTALREEKALLERASQIDRQAQSDVNESIRSLQDEVLELKEELAFYRGIVSPQDDSRGLRLQSFRIERAGSGRSYRYKVVLTQVLQNDTVARGSVLLTVSGTADGRERQLALVDLTADGVKELNYRFKYFQNLEGDMVLPKGFKPLRATVKVIPSARNSDPIEETFDWPA